MKIVAQLKNVYSPVCNAQKPCICKNFLLYWAFRNIHTMLYTTYFRIEQVSRPQRPCSIPPDYSHHVLNHRHFVLDMCDVLTVLAFRNKYPVEHPSIDIKITLIIRNSEWTRMGTRIRNQTIRNNNECTHNGQPYKTGVRHALASTQLLDRRIVSTLETLKPIRRKWFRRLIQILIT